MIKQVICQSQNYTLIIKRYQYFLRTKSMIYTPAEHLYLREEYVFLSLQSWRLSCYMVPLFLLLLGGASKSYYL